MHKLAKRNKTLVTLPNVQVTTTSSTSSSSSFSSSQRVGPLPTTCSKQKQFFFSA